MSLSTSLSSESVKEPSSSVVTQLWVWFSLTCKMIQSLNTGKINSKHTEGVDVVIVMGSIAPGTGPSAKHNSLRYGEDIGS